MRNESRAALFQDSDESDEQGSETEKIEFEIEEEEEEADETSKKQMNQLVIARMISGPGERKAASTANETFQSVLAASGHDNEDSELRRVLLTQKCNRRPPRLLQ